jgi:catechol 2,3-dioxygenase-like lactoylglutathione lyase family enzyme
MSVRKLSRRRALQIAGAAAVPSVLLTCSPACCSAATQETQETTRASEAKQPEMPLGAFSVSLAVNDLKASREFYEKLGFKSFAGEPAHNWQILKNGDHVIGLFQGMFDKNIMTFNPGWDQNAKKLDEFIDVREIQKRLKKQGVKMLTEADEKTTGPASFTIADPDGNMILFDKHV